jgi:hypothetical protein
LLVGLLADELSLELVIEFILLCFFLLLDSSFDIVEELIHHGTIVEKQVFELGLGIILIAIFIKYRLLVFADSIFSIQEFL